ncbi:MAG: response regulator, partial [Calditrichaeota bacterium]|nr:response regulator [Calditrichota bacterium]
MIDFDPKQVKILIVEDTRESLDLLTYFLKPSGYQLISVIDGVEALEYINKDLPDLILLDVMLPRLNGFQVCERLKKDKRTFHIPIIMITALKDLKDKIRALEAGADDFVTKPFDSVELVARVKSLLKSKFYYDKLKQQNIELERQKNALEEEDRLKEQLTELIAHDMRSP